MNKNKSTANETLLYQHMNPYDSTLVEMIEAGRFENYRVCVYANEGPVPHFHFYQNSEDTQGGCIRLDRAEFFPHGSHQATVGGRVKKQICDWMKSPHRQLGKYGLNNWQAMCIYWGDSNPNYPLPENLEMPDYSKII